MSSRAVPLWTALLLLAAVTTAVFAQTGADSAAGTAAAVQTAAPNPPLPGESVGGMVLRMIFALALVVGLIYVCVYLFRRFLAGREAGAEGGGGLRVIGHQYLGPRRSIYLVEVAGRILVVGAGGSSVNLLTEITDTETVEQLRSAASAGGIHYPFSQYLDRFLKKDAAE